MIIAGYLVFVCGLSICKYVLDHSDSDAESLVLANNKPYMYVFFILPVFFSYMEYSMRAKLFFYTFISLSCTLYLHLFVTSYSVVFLNSMLCVSMFHIIRYNIYYNSVIHTIESINNAQKKFVLYGIVSNFANVIELRAIDVLRYFEPPYILLYSLGFVFVGCLTKCFVFKVVNNSLFNAEIKRRRLHIQSGITLCGFLSQHLITQGMVGSSDLYIERSLNIADYVPIAITCAIIFLSRHVFKLSYRMYSFLCPTISLVSYFTLLFTNNRYVSATVFAAIQTMFFVLFDPTRFILYVTHTYDVVSFFLAYDTLAIGLSYIMYPYLLSLYKVTIPMVNCIWIGLVYYSVKYYRKDMESMECINLLELC